MSGPRIALLALLGVACGKAPPQREEEAKVTYRVAFEAETGVVTRVYFPWVADGAVTTVQTGLAVTDGGTASVESTQDGLGLLLEGKGRVEASFEGGRVNGLSNPGGIPDAKLTREVADGGVGDRWVQVNKGGSATAQIEFEYTAQRDCGGGCGGRRSWTFSGPVGLSRQVVPMQFTEEEAK